MSKRKRPVLISVTSDQHGGSTVAACPPKVSLDDGGAYEASKAQRWLFQCWENFHDRVAETRKKLDADLYCVFNGDMTDGDHHGTTQILSGNPTAQAAVVNALMAVPLSLSPDRLFFVRGTEAHVGKSACFEERIADGLRRDKRPVAGDPDTGNASHWHLRMDVLDKRLDFAHHGRLGQRPWTKGNIVLNQAAEIFYEHAARGERHPDVAVRSHMHRYFDTYHAHPTRVIQTAAWQLATAFIHRIAPGSLADIGGVLLAVREDQPVEVTPVLYRAAPPAVWRAAA